jgi:hypothetical protein
MYICARIYMCINYSVSRRRCRSGTSHFRIWRHVACHSSPSMGAFGRRRRRRRQKPRLPGSWPRRRSARTPALTRAAVIEYSHKNAHANGFVCSCIYKRVSEHSDDVELSHARESESHSAV